MEVRQKRILVIDDEPDHLSIARETLSAEGYEVLTHQSPFGGMSLIQASSPDLVLMDVNMPSFPGDDLAAFLKSDERTRSVPVVLYSSADEGTLMSAVTRYGLFGYICKGDSAELLRKVAHFLGSHLTDAFAFRKQLYAVE